MSNTENPCGGSEPLGSECTCDNPPGWAKHIKRDIDAAFTDTGQRFDAEGRAIPADDQPRGHEGHDYNDGTGYRTSLLDLNVGRAVFAGSTPVADLFAVDHPRTTFARLSLAFASLSLIGDAVEWMRRETGGRF